MSQAGSVRSTFLGRIALLWVGPVLLLFGSPAAFSDEPCQAAAVWTAPQQVSFENILRDVDKQSSQPNLTVFIELPDGSAADIDPGSVRLNDLPALDHPSSVGDNNGNGVPDRMVKFNRGSLITTTGPVTITGLKTTNGCFTGDTGVEIQCLPSGVQRADDWVDYTTSNMPDPALNGRAAKLEVHRVEPVFPPSCHITPIRAVVLVHALSTPAPAAFDLQFKDYSLMETLAMRGIRTFTFNHLGFGHSAFVSGWNPLDDPCNASLPQCSAAQCASGPIAGVCDCSSLNPLYKRDQQGSTAYLRPNPLPAYCPHTSSVNFQFITHQLEQLDLVVDYARAETGLEKIHLLAWSLGGSTIGKYLGEYPGGQQKVAAAVFLAPTFGGLGNPTSTWPLGLINRADTLNTFNLAGPTCAAGDGCTSGCPVADPDCATGLAGCPGQKDPEIADPIWTATTALDPVGPGWGPPDGLSRYPVVPRFGWVQAVAEKIEVPALLINGLKDSVVPVNQSVNLWSVSPPQDPPVACTSDADCATGYACRPFPTPQCRLNSRTLVQLNCASHGLHWETCSGEGCVDPHLTVQKLVRNFILTGR